MGSLVKSETLKISFREVGIQLMEIVNLTMQYKRVGS